MIILSLVYAIVREVIRVLPEGLHK